jgi:hypothetical protein
MDIVLIQVRSGQPEPPITVEELLESVCDGAYQDVSERGSLVERRVVGLTVLQNTESDGKLGRGARRQVRRGEALLDALGDSFLARLEFEFDLSKLVTLPRAAVDADDIVVDLPQYPVVVVVECQPLTNRVELHELPERLAPDDPMRDFFDAARDGVLAALP